MGARNLFLKGRTEDVARMVCTIRGQRAAQGGGVGQVENNLSRAYQLKASEN